MPDTGELKALQSSPLVHQVTKKQPQERKPFVLPQPAGDNSYLISYLNNERGISKAVIELFLKENLIYESRHYHNIVFKGNDKNGVTRFASMRGVFDKQGKPFKCDVEGNNKNYGFNVVNVNSTELVVFEAAIDLMSYVDIFADYESNKLALGMLADAPLETFLGEHPQISFIRFCLDGDSPAGKQPQNLWRNTMDWAMRLRTVLRQQDTRITMNGLLLQNLISQMRKRSR